MVCTVRRIPRNNSHLNGKCHDWQSNLVVPIFRQTHLEFRGGWMLSLSSETFANRYSFWVVKLDETRNEYKSSVALWHPNAGANHLFFSPFSRQETPNSVEENKSSWQEPLQDIHTRTSKRIPQDRIEGPPRRPLQDLSLRASHKSFQTSTFSTRHQASCKDPFGFHPNLHKIISTGSEISTAPQRERSDTRHNATRGLPEHMLWKNSTKFRVRQEEWNLKL